MYFMSKNVVTLSVIVPIYNSEKTLSKCIESILCQTIKDFELLLIDDGSTDSSGVICDTYASSDARVKVIHKSNGGVSKARNAGLDIAQGQWIVFVDSDDWAEPEYLSDFFRNQESSSANSIVLQGRINEVKGRETNRITFDSGIYTNVTECLIKNNMLTFGAPYCKLYSRKLIEKHLIRFPENYSYGEDTVFFLKTLTYVDKIITVSRCNYHYVEAEMSSLSKKDHDFKPLSDFLIDSMHLISELDLKSCAHGALVSAYMPNYRSLLLRSIANMYRLRYSNGQLKSCLKTIKNRLLPNCSYSVISGLSFIKHTPTWLLIPAFRLILKFRK